MREFEAILLVTFAYTVLGTLGQLLSDYLQPNCSTSLSPAE